MIAVRAAAQTPDTAKRVLTVAVCPDCLHNGMVDIADVSEVKDLLVIQGYAVAAANHTWYYLDGLKTRLPDTQLVYMARVPGENDDRYPQTIQQAREELYE